MADTPEVDSLRRRIAELEQQLAEERESFQWDLKAARESAEATIKKLEQQLAELQKGAPKHSGGGDLDMLQRRAMLAEKKVAELQNELQRALASKLDKPATGDSFLRQRAEQAEKEREDLRREKRALERKLEELEGQLRIKTQELAEAGTAENEVQKLREELGAKERELKKLERVAQAAEAEGGELKALREKLELAEKQSRQNDERLRRLEEQLKVAEASRQEAERRAGELAQKGTKLEAEINRLKLASSQMIEQRERESMRLQADLREAEDRRTQTDQNIAQTRQENERLQRELESLRRERDLLRQELSTLREDRETKVTKTAPEAVADPFEEKTVKTLQPAGATSATVKDGRPLGAQVGTDSQPAATPQPPPPPVNAQTLEEEVIVGELVQEKSETTPLELDRPAPAEPVPVAKFGRTGTEIVRGKELSPEGERLPMAASRKVATPRRSWLGPALVVVAAAGLIALAWYKFPAWFGTPGEENAENGAVAEHRADAGATLPSPAAEEEADAGEKVATPEPVEAAVATTAKTPAAMSGTELENAAQEIRGMLAKKRFVEALAAAAKLVELNPENALAHHLYGRALFHRDDFRRSLEELQRSLELDPSLRESHYEMIGVCLRSGDRACACQAAKQFVKSSPPRDKKAEVIKRNLKKFGCD